MLDAVKVFRLLECGKSLQFRFQNAARSVVTKNGPIHLAVAEDAPGLENDPVFSVGGDLAFNWVYGGNGNRIVLTGGYLADVSPGANEDNTHGIGGHLACDCTVETEVDPQWRYEVDNIQDCPWPACTRQIMQGTDHGSGFKFISGAVYGNYAIFVSSDATSFLKPGERLTTDFDMVC